MNKSKSIKDFNIKELLGVGSYGKVYRVTKKKNENVSFVLKQISLFNMKDDEIKDVKNESKLLSQINCKYIVKYYESWIENNCLNIIMEYCEKGDLSKLIKQYSSNGSSNTNVNSNIIEEEKGLPEEKIWNIFIQLCIGLHYLHSRKILHRDLKTQNILISKNDTIKIADFGVAKALSHTTFAKTFVGTPYYLSPEICEEKPYNEKSDIWALGCCIFQMTNLKHPFNASNQPALIMKILNNPVPPILSMYSKELQEIVNLMLDKDHSTRPKLNEIIRNESFLIKCKQYNLLELLSYETGIFENQLIKFNNITGIEKQTLSKQISSPKNLNVPTINNNSNINSVLITSGIAVNKSEIQNYKNLVQNSKMSKVFLLRIY